MRFCIGCKMELPLSEFHSWTKPDRPSVYYPPRCKTCRNKERRESGDDRARSWDRYLSRQGLDRDGYDRLLEAQGGGCAICGCTDNGPRKFAIDHDHGCCPTMPTCGRCVRGLLCTKCNTGLGAFRDDTEIMLAAMSYLRTNLSTAR